MLSKPIARSPPRGVGTRSRLWTGGGGKAFPSIYIADGVFSGVPSASALVEKTPSGTRQAPPSPPPPPFTRASKRKTRIARWGETSGAAQNKHAREMDLKRVHFVSACGSLFRLVKIRRVILGARNRSRSANSYRNPAGRSRDNRPSESLISNNYRLVGDTSQRSCAFASPSLASHRARKKHRFGDRTQGLSLSLSSSCSRPRSLKDTLR